MTRRHDLTTRAVHAGQTPDPASGARAPAIHQTTSYVFPDATTAADRYALSDPGDVYTRISNPTTRTLEARLADLENGTDAVATASGMAAFDALTTVLASAGEQIVSSAAIYGGTASYLSNLATRRGIETTFVESSDPDDFAAALTDQTAFLHVETLGNPSLVTPDFEALAALTDEAEIPFVVDNTFATPALTRPIDYGADVVWESTTKWLHGSGTTLGGVVIDGGTFPWKEHGDRYPEIGAENPAFQGVIFADRFGDRAFAEAVRHRAVRSIGSAQSPFDAWQTIQGVETLPLRMARHCENAQVVAEFLSDHPEVEWVTYPGLATHPTHELASQYLDGGYGGMIAFGPSGGFSAAETICESVELASFLANVGDAKTLIIHPASTTHAQLSEEEQRSAGVTPDLVRLSVGIEDPGDIIADLEQALDQAAEVT